MRQEGEGGRYDTGEARVFSRRQFLASLAVPLAFGQSSTRRPGADAARTGVAVPRTPEGYPPFPDVDPAEVGRALRRQYGDLRHRFVFEYYPWYGTDPWRHWDGSGRTPPYDISATAVPELGPYDSLSARVIEQHARWIAESGVGAINVSWWGRGEYEDRIVPLLMDVMRDHGLKVTFHLEPYDGARAESYASDIQYLITEYGDKRSWDCQLILAGSDGEEGPVFRSFATLVPQFSTDCHGVTTQVSIWRPDGAWRRQTDVVRETLRRSFDHVWLLSDSPEPARVVTAGFDGGAPYGAFTTGDWHQLARTFRQRNLIFSPSIHTGFDAVVERNVPPDSCYRPPAFLPPATIDWRSAEERERAAQLAVWQIESSMLTSLDVQTNPALGSISPSFFIVYIATFNEWHEGTAFEPMKNRAELLRQELPFDYHNPEHGRYRLDYLKQRLPRVIRG